MKTLFESNWRAPLFKSCIGVVLAAAAVPLLLLPGCSSFSLQAPTRTIVLQQGSPAADAAAPEAPAAPGVSLAQSPCPAINFQTAQQLTTSDPSVFFGMQRQTDGSFTEQTYTANTATQIITKTGSIANIQQGIINCSGLASRTRKVVPPGLQRDPLGAAARNPIGADLAGDGAGSMVGWADFMDVGQVMVQRANLDATPRSSFAAYTVGTGAGGVISADFNGDGKRDIAVIYTGSSQTASGPGGVSILLGNGDGTLKPAVNYTTGANAWTGTAFDFNGDGRADLAVGHYIPGDVVILLGNADGTMKTGATYHVGGQNPILSIAAADLNNDQKGDLVVLSASALYILYGKGDGTFQTGPTIPVNSSYGSVGVGDFNRDGIMDIAVTDSGSGIAYVLLGLGNGTYSTPVGYAEGSSAPFYVEDFDGDGNLDLVFGAGHPDAVTPMQDSGTITVLFGNGDGTFASGAAFTVDGNQLDQNLLSTNVVVADFNGDGKPDIATSNPTGKSVSVALGRGAGAFNAPASISLGTVQPNSIAAGAFTSGGKPDIVVTDGVSNIEMLFHNGDGTFQKPIAYPTGGTKPSFVVTGDFNGDQKLDVAVANAGSNNISILPGFGDSSFNNPILTAVGPNPVGLVAGDFNGDGKLDLAVANGGTFSTAGTNLGSVSVLLGKGDGTFQAAVNYPAYKYPTFITAADVNGDGKLDLLVTSRGPNGVDEVAVLLGTGNGAFQAATLVPTAAGPVWISVADFSLDGKLDLVVAHCCGQTNNLTTLVGNGDGTFQPEVTLTSGFLSYFSTATGDFNGDGKPDLAYTAFSVGAAHTVTALLNISVAPVKLGTLVVTSAAGNPIKPPPVAPYSIVTAKGTDLATGTLVNTATNPPTTMLGTTAAVQDSAGVSRPAQLFYVSAVQVNFLIPQATAVGNATVTITSGDGFVSVGTVAVTAISPSIFTLNSNSLAAAYVQRVHGDFTQSIEYLYAVDAAGNVTFPPIDLGPATDQVYVNIYGTGIQGRSSLSAVVISVGGASTPALYAGPSGYPGEDQVAILLPRSLVGAGTVNVLLSADGFAANTTTLNIK